jgi:3',5'-cyclic AMP phosphodiesterase CpdA
MKVMSALSWAGAWPTPHFLKVQRFMPIIYRLAVVASLLLGTDDVSAHDPKDGYEHDHGHVHKRPPVPLAEADEHAATPMPDRILLGWKGDPARSQAITWRTDTSVEQAYIEYALAIDGPLFVADAVRVEAVTTPHLGDLGLAHYHAANLTELEPETLYVYRVGDGVNWSAWIHFRTASEEPKPFTFIYFGDAQNDVKSHWSRVFREAFKDAPKASFMLHAGDLINRGNRDAEWGEWCSAGGWVNAMIPTIAIPGNHEYDIDRSQPLPESAADQKAMPRSLSSRWQTRFEFPENGPPEFADRLGETAYYIDYQGVRIIGLNSMEDVEVQARWLEEVLSNSTQPWTIVTHHHPVYSVSKDRDNPELRAAWQPIYDKYKVDLVLQGHDHSYGRTGLRKYENESTGTTARSDEAGTVYVVSVSGPKQYAAGEGHFTRRAENTQLYQIITVDGDMLKYQAMTATGHPYDGFTLRKRAGSVNELIEEIPDIPERRLPVEKEPLRKAS